ncbi:MULTISPECIES: hypothetical protein [unclassified Fusibacter]|uniref:hypothetical protein n=1 Tax=unclassified Fusibacter TaxID=2624464 RepID=UPI001011AFF1|nr:MULTISPECIES: hypothetical protein [unclassified Fusibacter]MCK8059594.1 hypothetical protein [Fusibacter sp. A2]NPE21395.1 hypothetical protein [Fusibacter sp. A1]RXV61810.1 hypothetical protein DWB64_06115 [Fusibacter sp. A1]
MIDKNAFDSIEAFITHLKRNENMVGIVEYGGRSYSDMSKAGDYDLTVIFDKPLSKNIEGVHFHIKGIPVDCMLLSVNDFMADHPLNEFLHVHMNCTILYDKDGITEALLNRINTTWKTDDTLSEFEVMLFRFTFRHILDKLTHRLHDNKLYTVYFIYSSMDWFLSCYARIRNWEAGKPKLHLKLIEENEPELYRLIEDLYERQQFEEKYEKLSKIAEYMLKPIGGLWKEDEVLFHLSPDGSHQVEEEERLLEILFGFDES